MGVIGVSAAFSVLLLFNFVYEEDSGGIIGVNVNVGAFVDVAFGVTTGDGLIDDDEEGIGFMLVGIGGSTGVAVDCHAVGDTGSAIGIGASTDWTISDLGDAG